MIRKTLLLVVMLIVAVLFASNSQAIPVAGGVAGTFINPTGPSGMITSGVGTDYFTWGDGANYGTGPSSLNFIGTSFAVETDDVFTFGTLNYFNGTIALDSQADSVDLNVAISLTTPAGVSKNFQYYLGLINVTNWTNQTALQNLSLIHI